MSPVGSVSPPAEPNGVSSRQDARGLRCELSRRSSGLARSKRPSTRRSGARAVTRRTPQSANWTCSRKPISGLARKHGADTPRWLQRSHPLAAARGARSGRVAGRAGRTRASRDQRPRDRRLGRRRSPVGSICRGSPPIRTCGDDQRPHASRQVQWMLAGKHRPGRKVPDLLVAAAAEDRSLTVFHYDADFDRIAGVAGQPCRWIVPAGSID